MMNLFIMISDVAVNVLGLLSISMALLMLLVFPDYVSHNPAVPDIRQPDDMCNKL